MVKRNSSILTLFCCVVLAACSFLTPAEPTTAVSQQPTESPWRLGTPEPLLAPISNECLGQGTFPPKLHGIRYGLNVFLFNTDQERVLALTDIAGFNWIRQQVHWRDLEGERMQYVWPPLDHIVTTARSHNKQIMLSIVRSPPWATQTGHDGLPDNIEGFASFLSQVATRYKGRVAAYEIWNEPNLSHESGGVPGDPATYLTMLETAYQTIKQADPCALVLAAPMAATNNPDPKQAVGDLPFYEALYTLNDGSFLRSADVIAVHPGAGPYPPSARWPDDQPDTSHYYFRHIERIHEMMQHYGDQRQVWITEVGWNVERAEGRPEPVTQQQQASYLVEVLWYIRQHYPWVAGVFVWNLNFSVIAPQGDEKATFSILDPDWTTRPAFDSLQHNVRPLRDANHRPLFSHGSPYQFWWSFPGRGPIRVQPLRTHSNTLYLVSHPGTIYAINGGGTFRWAYHAPGVIKHAPALAPDGTLFVGHSGALLTAIQPNGTVSWNVRLRSPVRGSPVYHDGLIYLVTEIGEIQCYNTFGQLQWEHHLQAETTPLTLSSDGQLLVGTAYGEMLKLQNDGQIVWGTFTGQELWAPPVATNDGGAILVSAMGHIFAFDTLGLVKWQATTGVPVIAKPLVDSNGLLYVAGRDGILRTFSLASGEFLRQLDTRSDLVAAPIQGDDGMVYFGTTNGRFLALGSDGAVQWDTQLHGSIQASPLLSPDGTLYVGTDGGLLYALQRYEQE
jgi:outer membrane protein assembly factor BamB